MNELTIFNNINANNFVSELVYEDQLKAMQIRNRIISDSDVEESKYLLPIEIFAFIKAELDSDKRILYTLLYATGARISELLKIKASDIKKETIKTKKGKEDTICYIKINTAKLNAKNRTKIIKNTIRAVDIQKSIYEKLESYIYTKKIKPAELLFKVTSRTVENWCKKTQKVLELSNDNITIPFNVTPKVFRHSFAIYHLYSGTNIKIIGKYLGHKRFKTTEIYTNILAIETALKREHLNFDVEDVRSIYNIKEKHRDEYT